MLYKPVGAVSGRTTSAPRTFLLDSDPITAKQCHKCLGIVQCDSRVDFALPLFLYPKHRKEPVKTNRQGKSFRALSEGEDGPYQTLGTLK